MKILTLILAATACFGTSDLLLAQKIGTAPKTSNTVSSISKSVQDIVTECEKYVQPGQTRTESPDFKICTWCLLNGGKLVYSKSMPVTLACDIMPMIEKSADSKNSPSF
jgi:hypothetical protein